MLHDFDEERKFYIDKAHTEDGAGTVARLSEMKDLVC